jgi:hypothetical protein
MMFREVTYETLLRDHPVQVQEAIEDLRKSRSKFRNDPPESFKWGYDWCVLHKGSGTLAEMLAREPSPPASIDEQVKEHGTACHVRVLMQKKSSRFTSELLATTPQFILDDYRKGLEERAAEQARFNALPPEERQRELESTLKQLRGPGFVAIQVPRRG